MLIDVDFVISTLLGSLTFLTSAPTLPPPPPPTTTKSPTRNQSLFRGLYQNQRAVHLLTYQLHRAYVSHRPLHGLKVPYCTAKIHSTVAGRCHDRILDSRTAIHATRGNSLTTISTKSFRNAAACTKISCEELPSEVSRPKKVWTTMNTIRTCITPSTGARITPWRLPEAWDLFQKLFGAEFRRLPPTEC